MSENLKKYSYIRFSLKYDSDKKVYLYSNYDKEADNKLIDITTIGDFKLEGIPSKYGENKYNEELFEYNPNATGVFEKLRLYETKNYFCSYTDSIDEVKFQNAKELDSKVTGKNQFSFKIVNYLGKAALNISFDNKKENVKISFEIIPLKIDYEDGYVKLTDDIADECSALLLDYSSPTNLSYCHDFTKTKKSPIEEFIFVRKFCSSSSIEYIFQSIINNPDRILVSEEELKPFGTSMVSKKFFTNPFENSKNWTRQNDGSFIPELITTTRKYDSFDTPANRFLQFAFEIFINVCNEIIDKIEKDSTYKDEAEYLKQSLQNVLNDSFFDDVQPLTNLPVNNQVLQKREGYVQVFNAFNMLDLAQQLNWNGQNDVYEGQARNIALLYEYWLVFKLIHIIKNLGAINDFDITEEKDITKMLTIPNELLISISEGAESMLSATIKNKNLRINFYYNRTFCPNDFNGTDYYGSYSRDFRPDYTLAIFPSLFTKEKDAIKAGEVSFIHFDAKYRVTDLTSLFGKEKETDDDFNNEKKEETINTYNRGDLLKMHTYNDAIRRTIGSYVLYPDTSDESKKFQIFDELLPGVGAFAIRPGDKKNKGEKELTKFISNIIEFKSKISSRQSRKDYFENIILNTPGDKSLLSPKSIETQQQKENKTETKKYIMCGMLRMDYLNHLNKYHFLPLSEDDEEYQLINPDSKMYFYYHAIKEKFVYSQHKNISNTNYFCGSKTDFGKSSLVELENWTASIEQTELVETEQLQATLKNNLNYELKNQKQISTI